MSRFFYPCGGDAKDKNGLTVLFERAGITAQETLYSDRLFQNAPDKYNAARLAATGNTGQYWDDVPPVKIEEFLSAYLGRDVKLARLDFHIHAANGNPVWGFGIS